MEKLNNWDVCLYRGMICRWKKNGMPVCFSESGWLLVDNSPLKIRWREGGFLNAPALFPIAPLQPPTPTPAPVDPCHSSLLLFFAFYC